MFVRDISFNVEFVNDNNRRKQHIYTDCCM